MAAHPTIVFRVKLDLLKSEVIGPLTNERSTAMLPPDRYQESADTAITDVDNRKNYRSTWMPGITASNNVNKKHADTFTLIGSEAVYVKNTFATGDDAIFVVVSES